MIINRIEFVYNFLYSVFTWFTNTLVTAIDIINVPLMKEPTNDIELDLKRVKILGEYQKDPNLNWNYYLGTFSNQIRLLYLTYGCFCSVPSMAQEIFQTS